MSPGRYSAHSPTSPRRQRPNGRRYANSPRWSNACLAQQGIQPVEVTLDYSWTSDSPVVVGGVQEQFDACIGSARKEQLRRYTAPAALFTLGQPAGTEPSTAFELSVGRTTGIAALVLVFTVGVSILGATRLVRPLHALTG
ncbi:hypothetical protein [Amycolatopsis sp. lyj-108]|uniref:hypothetical protein n=1 Tax=Amycolatopsis sp. lyj-108 TaxID=2789286 RepID=UPI00397D8F0D